MDWLDVAFVGALFLLVGSYMWDFAKFTGELSESGKKQCPPHDWGYNAENKLQCKHPRCRYIAGSDHIPRGDENAQ